jgi:hypothetical protein
MWIVVAVIGASSFPRAEVVGSRGGREEVEGSCSWVAMMGRWVEFGDLEVLRVNVVF